MEIKFYGVCVANGYRTIRAIEPSDVNDFLPRMRRKNDEIEQLTGERPWGLFTNERVEQINDLFEFVSCGYDGNPAIRDIATQIEIFVLND